ncbi:Ti-type conjugative transfer relaxase TraA [Acidisoma silvae]|uniref:Ti-type conjugative transfer relaxase TraA n=1 Tax=Acidisoma silvae TaxID=2802396 RepID=A0A963YX89_9PROT|nr:Ti-type conjugative transfer relaxase TraA [Acidisoma silvae]MCB8878529.1 Ti-type conjugative transfer relaxase TraA [Acidisoma silvae]
MAIYHLSMKPMSRGSGRSAVAAAAYRAAETLENQRDGLVHDFSKRSGVEHAEIVVPGVVGADWARDRSALWNAAEASEKRKDARVAREIEVALPHELSSEQRLDLTRGFAAELAGRYGVAVDFAIHSPHGHTDVRNHHAHIMMTTRKVGPEGLGEKSELELENKRLVALGLPTSHAQLRDLRARWEERTNAQLARAGLDLRVDHRSHRERGLEIEPTQHMGVHATQMARQEKPVSRTRIDAAAAQRNANLIREKPEQVLALITGEKSVFDRRDVARALHRYVEDAESFQAALAKVMASPALVELQAEQRDAQGHVLEPARYSTQEMVGVERDMAVSADRMAEGHSFWVAKRWVDGSIAAHAGRGMTLTEEQQAAVRHVTGPERIATVVGLAGAGKSTMLAAARSAWASEGYRVHGAALAGKAAEGLEESSGIPSRTLASWERGWERGFDQLGPRDVFVIDEAGMVGSTQLSRFITAADRAGAKVVLVGDPEQLQPIGPGAAFRAIAERVGFVELSEVRRQREDWQRAASVDFGRHRTVEGLAAYAEHGAIRFEPTVEQARDAIVRDVMLDRAVRPNGSRLVLAHRRVDVLELNDAIRSARLATGELADERVYQTTEGQRAFAPGDRLMFRENNRDLGVKNGMLGTVETAEEDRLVVRLDDSQGRPGQGRTVAVSMADYAAVDHGYATTIHKAQGATVDRAFVFASGTMDRHLTYVAMTRHRERVTLYAGRDELRDIGALKTRLSRSQAKETTLDYERGTPVEMEAARAGYAERRGLYANGLVPESEIVVRDAERQPPAGWEREQEREGSVTARPAQVRPAQALAPREDSLRAKVRKAQTEREAPRAAPHLPTLVPEPERGTSKQETFDARTYLLGLTKPVAQEQPSAARAVGPMSSSEAARAGQRQELLAADSWTYSRALEAATVQDRNARHARPMTVADAARLVSPDYAAVADRLDRARADLVHSEKAIEENRQQRDDAIDQGDKRWQRMGTLAQYGHRMGIKPDRELEVHEASEKGATMRLTTGEVRHAERLLALPDLERQERDALAAVRPQAEEKLEQLQDRAALAREVQAERRQVQQQKAQEEGLERKLSRGKSQGLGIGR